MVKYSGTLPCFCEAEDLKGVPSDTLYGVSQVAVCREYSDLWWRRALVEQGISVFIIVLNVVLTKLIVLLVAWIGYETHSQVYSKISIYIFYATFFNTAIVILLANAALGDKIPLIAKMFSGTYNDYSFDWYSNVGNQIVVSMVINAIMPVVEYLIEHLLSWHEVRSD
jgi:hypothetical protein